MENTSNITYKFSCEKCKFFCVKKGDYNRHINTKKHKNNLKDEERLNEYRCNCGKIYKHHSSLWNHKKVCNGINKEKEDKLINAINGLDLTLNKINLYLSEKDSEKIL